MKKTSLLILAFAAVAVACSILKKEDDNKEINAFLETFQTTLGASDKEIMSLFQTSQARETLLQAVRVLQNKGVDFIQCQASFKIALINRLQDRTEIILPVTLTTKGLETISREETSIIFYLDKGENGYVISRFDAEQFYQAYTSLKNANEWAAIHRAEFEKREPYYAVAQSLESKFDTVCWYSVYNGNAYYYAASEWWNNYFLDTDQDVRAQVKMGMVDMNGDTLIPFDYDLIGTIAFDFPDMVEVRKEGMYGYFDIIKKEFVTEVAYDMIIPIKKGGVAAIVRQDSVYGWLNDEFAYTQGFPDAEIEQWIKDLKYLSQKIVLRANGEYTFCEIPSKAWTGCGIIMPPSYYVKHDLFAEIIGGVNTTEVPMNGWTDYVGMQESLIRKISDKFQAMVTVLEERYLGGREEFYGESKIVLMNERQDVLAITRVQTDQEINISVIDSTLLEIAANSTGYWFDAPGNEQDIPVYSYFQIDDNSKLSPLESKRKYAFTEFVKIDSSYLEGSFRIYRGYNEETDESIYDETNFLSQLTIIDIRNEILASYGYSFPEDISIQKRFDEDWYNPQFDSRADFEDVITDIDRHNLAFLERVIALLEENTVV